MTTSKEYLDFILEQLSTLKGITYRKMMGKYFSITTAGSLPVSAMSGCWWIG